MKASGTIESKSWEFQPIEELQGIGNLIRMSAVDLFHGDLDAEARAEFVALSRVDKSSDFAGMYRVSGRLGDRSGTFLLQTVGSSDASGTSRGTWRVVPASATDGLAGLSGTGDFTYEAGGSSSLTLDYEFHRS